MVVANIPYCIFFGVHLELWGRFWGDLGDEMAFFSSRHFSGFHCRCTCGTKGWDAKKSNSAIQSDLFMALIGGHCFNLLSSGHLCKDPKKGHKELPGNFLLPFFSCMRMIFFLGKMDGRKRWKRCP